MFKKKKNYFIKTSKFKNNSFIIKNFKRKHNYHKLRFYSNFLKLCLLKFSLFLKLSSQIICTIKQEEKNVYLNFSYLNGFVFWEVHSGMLYKNSLRKSQYALEAILRYANKYLYKNFYKFKGIILNIKGNHILRNMTKKLPLLFKVKIKFYKINIFIKDAHNGVRLRKKRRK